MVDYGQHRRVIDLLDAGRLVFPAQSEIKLLLDRHLPVQLLLLVSQLWRALPLPVSLIESAQGLLRSSKLPFGRSNAALDKLAPLTGRGLASMQVEIGKTVEKELEYISSSDGIRCFHRNADDARSLIDGKSDPFSECLDSFIKVSLRSGAADVVQRGHA